MNKNIKYITENYLDAEALCSITGISITELDRLIEQHLIPNCSYTIENTSVISSPLGDEEIITLTKRYFPKSVIPLIAQNLNCENPDHFKQQMKEEFISTFTAHQDNSFAYGNILNNDGSVNDNALAEAFETEWEHYLNGIYGICTINSTGAEIAKKEIAVKKLIDFIEQNKGTVLNEIQQKALIALNDQFNEVANDFAPYQRVSSSRGKYLDKILMENSLEELIKPYN